MDIAEVQKKKAGLQCQIINLISDFEKETGTSVVDVNYFVENHNGLVLSKGLEIKVEI